MSDSQCLTSRNTEIIAKRVQVSTRNESSRKAELWKALTALDSCTLEVKIEGLPSHDPQKYQSQFKPNRMI